MFNTFKKVLANQPITTQDADKVSDFILRRWLTGDNRLIELANTLNCLPGKLDNLLVLRGIAYALNGKVKFIKYIQGTKQDKVQEEDVVLLAKFFRVSLQEALEYLEFLKMHYPEELQLIRKIGKELV